MTIAELLTLRHRAYVRWVEPWPGLDAQGNESHADMTIATTVDGVIKMGRHDLKTLAEKLAETGTAIQVRKVLETGDEELLLGHLLVHWGEVVIDGAVIKLDIDPEPGQVPSRCADPSPGQNM